MSKLLDNTTEYYCQIARFRFLLAKLLKSILFGIILLAVLTGFHNAQDQKVENVEMNNLPFVSNKTKHALEAIKDSRILFGHQSVGNNILTGVQSLAENTGVDIKIEKFSGKLQSKQNVFAHSMLGKNTDPKSKIDDFASQIRGLGEFKPQIAFMKLCYVDFTADSNIKELFTYH